MKKVLLALACLLLAACTPRQALPPDIVTEPQITASSLVIRHMQELFNDDRYLGACALADKVELDHMTHWDITEVIGYGSAHETPCTNFQGMIVFWREKGYSPEALETYTMNLLILRPDLYFVALCTGFLMTYTNRGWRKHPEAAVAVRLTT